MRPATFCRIRIGVVGVGNVEVLAQDLHARAIRRAASVRCRAAVEHEHVLAGERAHEFIDQSGLAHAGVADDRSRGHRYRSSPRRSNAPSNRCNSAWRPTNGVIARVGAASNRERDSAARRISDDFDRALETLHLERADRARFDVVAREANGIGGRENRAWLGDLLHPRGDVHGDADRGVAHVQAMLAHAQYHLAGIEPDADLDRHAMGTLDFVAVMAHQILHGERGARGAHGVILRGDRRAEERHDAVAHHLAHRAAILLDRLAHVLEHRVEQLACLFRVAIGHQFHRSLEVGEKDRDELALAFERRGKRVRAGGSFGRALAAADVAATRWPHSMQNLALNGSAVPHEMHFSASLERGMVR